jgi:hypothetical protein
MNGDRHDLDTVVVVPVLRRPHRVGPFLDSLEASTPEPHRVVFVATAGDAAMIAAVLEHAEADPLVSLELLAPNRVGDYAKKCNHAYRVSSEPFLFLAADDLDFHRDWLTAALELMADPAAGVVGTQDLAPTERARSGEHSTHCLVRRRYVDELGTVDEPGKILHEGYPHEYVDDELVETAKARGAWRFAAGSVVEHLHPSWGKAPRDPIYNQQRRRMAEGRRVYVRRRGLWTTPSR